jgi:lysophospholipid acyltransferase (LPLAT)-like uncharacterized protein
VSDAPAPRLPWHLRLAVWLARRVVRGLGATWRITVLNGEGGAALRRAGTPHVIAIWHGELFSCLYQHRDQGIAVLISEHRDGELIAQVAEGIGYAPSVRGSSTRGAARALLQLVRTLQEGRVVGITPDRPRGPRRRCAPGAVAAAQRAGVPILPLRAVASSAWRFNSWDRFTIPKPFARVVLSYGTPYVVPAGAEALAAAPAVLEAAMDAAGKAAGDVE